MLDRNEFKAWLLTLEMYREFDGGCNQCPLAEWLQSQGYEDAWVDGSLYCLEGPFKSGQELPAWATGFAAQFDSIPDNEPSTVRRCLSILEELEVVA